MRIIRKILFKVLSLAIMVVLMSSAVRYGQRYISKTSGVPQIPGVNFSSEESDLMSTIFKSALRLVSGTAKREELAGELSDKLYSGRAGAGEMSELGIELVKPGGASPVPDSKGATIAANPQPGLPTVKPVAGASAPSGTTGVVSSQPVAKLPAKAGTPAADSPAAAVDVKSQAALQAKVWEQAKRYSVELGVVPVALLGMYLMHRIRGRRSGAEDFVPANLAMQAPSDSEPYDMKNPLHSMKVEDFELLVALIYQRQGYRVSMPAGLSGGRGIDFTLVRKSERVLVQCKRMNQESRVTIERIRELHDAVTAAGATRGMYIASCGFTWDARNFAKAKGLMVINARTLDELVTAAKESADEDLMDVSRWIPKLMSKAELTTPHCPACEAPMEQITGSDGAVWVCSQRPECRGRRSARKHQKPAKMVAIIGDSPADAVAA